MNLVSERLRVLNRYWLYLENEMSMSEGKRASEGGEVAILFLVSSLSDFLLHLSLSLLS